MSMAKQRKSKEHTSSHHLPSIRLPFQCLNTAFQAPPPQMPTAKLLQEAPRSPMTSSTKTTIETATSATSMDLESRGAPSSPHLLRRTCPTKQTNTIKHFKTNTMIPWFSLQFTMCATRMLCTPSWSLASKKIHNCLYKQRPSSVEEHSASIWTWNAAIRVHWGSRRRIRFVKMPTINRLVLRRQVSTYSLRFRPKSWMTELFSSFFLEILAHSTRAPPNRDP